MTEASHQITANPLPPRSRVPGSVGIARSTEVAILGLNGEILSAGESGEVAIRGPNVTSGYENAPEANAAAFINGWLRTGDSGYIDPDGYLHLLGRIKEIINRGGEKVSPFEVEEALLAHPAVKEAAAFPVRDTALGEEVGAAVVLRQNATVSELKEFLAVRLAYFKVPTRLLIVDVIPKGPTGKVSRVNMAEKLGLSGLKKEKALERTAPAPGTETELAKIWAEMLRCTDIYASDNFLELGGDSLMATRAISRVREAFGVEVPIVSLLDADDLSAFARTVERRLKDHIVGTDEKGEKAREKV
jgi:acyl carrier protein